MKNWLNYHHLYYFWTIAEEQSVSRAAEKLRLAQPTLSAQLKQLERTFETTLFYRQNNRLTLTEQGQIVKRYANTIFSLGAELQATLEGTRGGPESILRVGAIDSVPKLVIEKTISPLLRSATPIKVICFEGKREQMFSLLGSHEIDVVLSDAPFASEVAVRAFNHPMGSSTISLCANRDIVSQLKGRSNKRFNDAPFILPTPNTMLRRAVDLWFERNDIRPRIIAEFEDSALLKTFGANGHGFFPVASVVLREVIKRYGVQKVTVLSNVQEEFFAITLDRKIKHPGIQVITEIGKAEFVPGGKR